MGIAVEALFTSALGLQPPWVVDDVRLDTAKRRIDFEIGCHTSRLACPACGAATQPVHDRLRRSWRHLDFFQFEAWLHCDVPRVACGACGKTTQVAVPWARPGSGFTAAFEALALTLCLDLPVRQAAELLRCKDKRLWRRIEFYVEQARALEDFSGVRTVGIDETSLRRGQHYITVVHDLDRKRLLLATEGREHRTVVEFAEDLKAHGGDPAQVRHVCMDMSAAYAKGVALARPRRRSATTAFTSSRWPSRRWTRCAARRWPPTRRRCEPRWALASVRRSGSCCGACGATPAAGAPASSRRCTGCSARRSRARGRGG